MNGDSATHSKEKTEQEHDDDLDEYDPNCVLKEDERAGGNRPNVNRHADGHKEETDEYSLERLNICLNLHTVSGTG